MRPLRLTLWGDFAEVEGTHLQQHLGTENILLASRVHIREYQGTITSNSYTFTPSDWLTSLWWYTLLICCLAWNILLGISVSTLPISRLLINPDIQATEDFEGWYIRPTTLVLISISHISYIYLISHMLPSLHVLGFLALMVWWPILILCVREHYVCTIWRSCSTLEGLDYINMHLRGM